MFSDSSSVSTSVHPSVRERIPKNLLARYLRTKWRDFHQSLVDDVVEAKDGKLLSFEGRRVKIKVATRSDVKKLWYPVSPEGLKVSQSNVSK